MSEMKGSDIPQQHVGAKSDVEYSVTCDSIEEAERLFTHATRRLLEVSNWEKICGKPSADFQLTDSDGNNIFRAAQRGNKFRIDIPAPGSSVGEGYDWVEVEEIVKHKSADTESISMRVRPCPNPTTPPEENDTAHFYTDDATSTFTVKRIGNTVSAEVHGRNEKPNTEVDGLMDKARNALVAIGAIIGLHKPQWKALVKGLLEEKD